MAKDKFGPAFDRDEYKGPLDVGPSKGQEGWTPANPTVPFPHDPLGYLKEHEESGRK